MAVKKSVKKSSRLSTLSSAPMVNNEMVKMQIEGLRSDRVVYAVEAVALSILSLLVFIGAPSVFPDVINPYDPSSLKILQGVIILPVAYWLLFTLIGNLVRLWKIQKLQRKLRES